MTTEPLVSSDDAAWQAFQNQDPAWFLAAAGREVRRYCGWHLAGSVTVTLGNLKIGSHGIIMLPTRHLTAVSEVIIQTGHDDQGATGVRLDPGDYTWNVGGWITRRGIGGPYLGGYDYCPNPIYGPLSEPGWAQVTFTHGYDDLPADIKAVIFELATSTTDTPSGNVTSVSAPNGYGVDYSQPPGLALNADQKARLSNYRLKGLA